MTDFIVNSPDSNKAVELRYISELHFGPMICIATSIGFKLPQHIGEILEFVNWSPNAQFLTLCEVVYEVKSDSHTFILWLIDTKQSVAKECSRSGGPIRVKEITNAGDVIFF